MSRIPRGIHQGVIPLELNRLLHATFHHLDGYLRNSRFSQNLRHPPPHQVFQVFGIFLFDRNRVDGISPPIPRGKLRLSIRRFSIVRMRPPLLLSPLAVLVLLFAWAIFSLASVARMIEFWGAAGSEYLQEPVPPLLPRPPNPAHLFPEVSSPSCWTKGQKLFFRS